MSEICSECLRNEMPSFQNKKFRLSTEDDLCESCGKWKKVVISVDERTFLDDIKDYFKNKMKEM